MMPLHVRLPAQQKPARAGGSRQRALRYALARHQRQGLVAACLPGECDKVLWLSVKRIAAINTRVFQEGGAGMRLWEIIEAARLDQDAERARQARVKARAGPEQGGGHDQHPRQTATLCLNANSGDLERRGLREGADERRVSLRIGPAHDSQVLSSHAQANETQRPGVGAAAHAQRETA